MNWQPTTYREIPLRQRRRGLSWRARVISMVIVLVAIGWYLLGFLEEPEEVTPPPAAPQASIPDERPRTGVIDRPDPTIGTAAPRPNAPASGESRVAGPARAGEEARAIIEGLDAAPAIETLDRAYAEGRALRDAGRTADAYLLFFYAAREGHAPSALALGAMADPAQAAGERGATGEPNLFEAHKWYALASELGNTTAEARLADLRSRVEAAAAAGDLQAERLLLQWR
jgi:TPR repeat protein